MDDGDDNAETSEVETQGGTNRTSEETPAARGRATPTGPLSRGRYQVIERLAKGGMGEVMIALDEQIGRTVAIKRMRAASPTEKQVRRFLREARIQGRLAHPAICKVHEIGVDEAGNPFFAMERLEGITLAQMLKEGLGESRMRVLRAFAEVCLAVELAHTRGIIHRDLKPENIMLGAFGEVFVIDWGVAKVIGEADEFADIGSGSGESGDHETKAGTVIGTPGYMAPEQVRGVVDIDGRADVYALGCVLFEILSGDHVHPPGRAGLESALLGGELRPSVRAPHEDIPPELDDACAQALVADRDARIPSARELGNRVQRYLDGDRDLALRQKLALGHFQRAQVAFARGDDARPEAMREAGRAIALDPKLVAAAELVTRLMLEPPKQVPLEVEQAIDLDNRSSARANARFGVFAYVAFLCFTPMLWVIGRPGSSGFTIAVSVLIALNASLLWIQSRSPTPRPVLIAAVNAAMVLVVSRMFSPFLIAPAIAAVIAMAIVIAQRMNRLSAGLIVGGMLSLAVLVPWFLELAGVFSPSTMLTDAGLLIDAPGIGRPGSPTLIVAAIYVVLLIAVACSLADAIRSRERLAKRHILLQAWQLRQLVAG